MYKRIAKLLLHWPLLIFLAARRPFFFPVGRYKLFDGYVGARYYWGIAGAIAFPPSLVEKLDLRIVKVTTWQALPFQFQPQ